MNTEDKIHGLTILLDDDYKDNTDFIGKLILALGALKGVRYVEKQVLRTDDYLARQKVKMDIESKITDVFTNYEWRKYD